MQPAFAQGRAPHDLAAQIDNAERLDALRHSPSTSHHGAGGALFDSLPASFYAASGSSVIHALLEARAARAPNSENNRAEATEVSFAVVHSPPLRAPSPLSAPALTPLCPPPSPRCSGAGWADQDPGRH